MAPCVWGLRLDGSTDVPVARRACLTALFLWWRDREKGFYSGSRNRSSTDTVAPWPVDM